MASIPSPYSGNELQEKAISSEEKTTMECDRRERLDNLVTVNVALHLHFIERLFQERVCREFQSILRSTYSTERISLRFTGNTVSGPKRMSERRDNQTRCALRIRQGSFDYYRILAHLFTHFKRFRCISLRNWNEFLQPLIQVLRLHSCQPTEVRRLKISFDQRWTSDELSVNTVVDLFNIFSHLLKSLSIKGEIANPISKVIARCVHLRKLSIDSYAGRTLNFEDLKGLNISRLKCDAQLVASHSGLPLDLVHDGRNLCSLFITGKVSPVPQLLQIVGRLHTFGMHFETTRQPYMEKEVIMRYLLSLPVDGYLIVIRDVDVCCAMKKMREFRNGLQFWFRLSSASNRDIRLCLRFLHEGNVIRNQPINIGRDKNDLNFDKSYFILRVRYGMVSFSVRQEEEEEETKNSEVSFFHF